MTSRTPKRTPTRKNIPYEVPSASELERLGKTEEEWRSQEKVDRRKASRREKAELKKKEKAGESVDPKKTDTIKVDAKSSKRIGESGDDYDSDNDFNDDEPEIRSDIASPKFVTMNTFAFSRKERARAQKRLDVLMPFTLRERAYLVELKWDSYNELEKSNECRWWLECQQPLDFIKWPYQVGYYASIHADEPEFKGLSDELMKSLRSISSSNTSTSTSSSIATTVPARHDFFDKKKYDEFKKEVAAALHKLKGFKAPIKKCAFAPVESKSLNVSQQPVTREEIREFYRTNNAEYKRLNDLQQCLVLQMKIGSDWIVFSANMSKMTAPKIDSSIVADNCKKRKYNSTDEKEDDSTPVVDSSSKYGVTDNDLYRCVPVKTQKQKDEEERMMKDIKLSSVKKGEESRFDCHKTALAALKMHYTREYLTDLAKRGLPLPTERLTDSIFEGKDMGPVFVIEYVNFRPKKR